MRKISLSRTAYMAGALMIFSSRAVNVQENSSRIITNRKQRKRDMMESDLMGVAVSTYKDMICLVYGHLT